MSRDTVTVSRDDLELVTKYAATALDLIFDRGVFATLLRLDEAASAQIPWTVLRPLISDLEAEDRGRLEAARAQIDQLQAYATHTLGDLGVDIRDPRVLFEAVAVLALVHQCAVNAAENEALSDDEASAVRALTRSLGVALGRLAPEEARR